MIRPIRIASDVFFTCEKNDASNQKPQRCEFRAKFPAFYCSLQRRFAHIQREKSFPQSVFLAKKVKNISEMEWNIFVCFTVDKENGREPVKQQQKGKTERDLSFGCAFCRSYFAFHLSLSLY